MNYDHPGFWLAYYHQQAVQSGHGLAGFHGSPYQRGAGLGSFFRSLFSMAIPVIKRVAGSTAKTVGKQALSAIGNVAANVTSGKTFKESLVNRGKEAISNVLSESAANIMQQSGSGLGVRLYRTNIRLPIKRQGKPRKAIVTKRRRPVKSDIFSA
jgi:hypothetical protein